ncbi:MAG: tyrosine-type recombinase/integrase [Burkholderiales bacterium]|nr:tyrosine-type recombinase/integrase [Burkholderiales bacterium]
MPQIKTNQLTVKSINDLHKTAKIGALLLDGNNLYIKKNANSLSWYYRVAFKSNTGIKRTWLAIGNYPQMSILAARDKALKVKDLINRGINPILMQANNNDRLGKPFSYVLKEYQQGYFKAISQNTKRNYINVIRHAVPLHNVTMELITEFDILDILSTIKKAGTDTVAKAFLMYIKKIFTYAKTEGYILENPTRDLSFSYSAVQRDRYLQPKELKQFLELLLSDVGVPLDIRIAIYSLVVLMLRRSELVELEWQHVDLKSGRVIVARTKTIKNFTLIIPSQLIKAWQLLTTQGQATTLFNFTDTTVYRNIVNLCIKYQVKRFTPHDLRRTAMSLLAEQGQDYMVIDCALAHTIKGVNKSYLKSNLLDKRAELLQFWANYIDNLLGENTAIIRLKNSLLV